MDDDFLDDFLSDLGAFQGSSLGSQLDMRRQSSTLSRSEAPAPKAAKPRRRQRDDGDTDTAPAVKSEGGQCEVWNCECCTFENPVTATACGACENMRNAYTCATCSKIVKPAKSGDRTTCRRCPTAVLGAPVPDAPVQPVTAAAAAPEAPPAEASAAFIPERAIGIVGSDTDSGYEDSMDEDEESSDSESSDADASPDPDHIVDDGASRAEKVGALMQSLAQRCAHDDLVPAPVPSTMTTRGQLRPFQLQALRWMLDREDNKTNAVNPRALELVGGGRCSGGILADFMGYGKTRTIISLCESSRRAARTVSGAVVFGAVVRSRATLIVCPVSLIAHWSAEIKRVVDEPRRILRYHGEGRKSVSLFDIAQEYDYVLTSFNTLAHEMRGIDLRNRDTGAAEDGEKAKRDFRPSPLAMVEWFRVVLDEAHYARNARAQQSRAIAQLSAARRWVVTATPMSNSVNDLFPLMHFLKVPLFGESDWWTTHVRKPVEAAAAASAAADGGAHAAVAAALPLQVILSVIMLRRTGESLDAVTKRPVVELPPKSTQLVHVRLAPAERAFYDALFEGGLLRLDLSRENKPGESRGDQHRRRFATALQLLMRCRQACCHVNFVIAALQKIRGTASSNDTTTTNVSGDDTLGAMTEQLARRNGELEARISEELRSRLAARHRKKKAGQKTGLDSSSYVASTISRIAAANSGAASTDTSSVANAAAAAADEGTDECVICMDAFTRPTMLPCAHIFCFECITTAMKAKRECPCCKQPCASDDLVDIDAIKAQARETASSDAAVSQLEAIDTAVVGPLSTWAPGSKLSAALDLMKAFPIDEKIIVFTQFSSFAELIVQHLNQRDEGDFHALAFTGALSANRRAAVLKDFESAPIEAPVRPRGSTDFFGAAIAAPGPTAVRPRHVVLVATVQTCGVGLNITCASRCIVMDPCWNPATEAQATNRCHRIGQTRPVFIYRMITEGTIELQIDKLANSKSAFADLCLSRAHRVQRMGLDDIVNVFDAALDADDLDDQ